MPMPGMPGMPGFIVGTCHKVQEAADMHLWVKCHFGSFPGSLAMMHLQHLFDAGLSVSLVICLFIY